MSRLWTSLGACAAALAATMVCGSLWNRTAHAIAAGASGEILNYCSPVEMMFSPDGARLYVLSSQSGEVRVLNATTYAPIKTIAVGHSPRGFSLSADGSRLFVANSWDDTVSVIDTRSLEVIETWPVAAEPSSVVEDRAGRYLFVANRISNDVAVLDARTGAEVKRLLAGRGASYITPTPDGRRLYVTHIYPNPGPARTPPESEITVIDAERAEVVDRVPLPSIAGVFHLAISADGRLGAAAELHPKNLVPLAHLEHGGYFVDTLTLFGADVGSKPVEIPLDELERYAARPFGVAITPDKSRIFITCGGAETVIAIDVQRLLGYIRTHRRPYAENLGASANYVIARIAVGHDPRGAIIAPDGRRLFVANRLDDTISVIDTRTSRLLSTIPLAGSGQLWSMHSGDQLFSTVNDLSQGKPQCSQCHIDEAHRKASPMQLTKMQQVTALRRGEQTFYTSRYSFQGQIGCANCHLDSTFDGLQWNLESNGFGRDIVDNRLLEDLRGTEPFKWNGGNPDVPTECGPRTEKYFWRSENYDDPTLADLATYILSLPPRPNRWRLPSGELTAAQERGKVIFERTQDKFGNPIPLTNRCSYCHSGPKGTSQKSFDVGTKKPTDNSGLLDTPQLTNIALTAPYLHDGSARTLEEIWTVYNPDDKHGRTNDITKDELNDLIEYLRAR
jgi:YVTN family beta-propeller protein